MANPHLTETYVRLQRQIAEHDRQIAEHQKERASRVEALEALKSHAPVESPAPAAKPAEVAAPGTSGGRTTGEQTPVKVQPK